MRTRTQVLTSPLFVCAVVVLVLNDHMFKGLWPSLVTGKLSDFAGVIVVAIALSVIIGRLAAVAATAAGFAALKTVPGVNEIAAPILGGTTLADHADLVAIAALIPIYVWLGRMQNTADLRPAWRVSPVLIVPAAAAAVLATTATSCAGPEGVITLAYEDDLLYAGIGEHSRGDRLTVDSWAVSEDGGHTWRESNAGPSDAATSSLDEAYDNSGVCWRVSLDQNLMRCNAQGICQQVYSAEQAPVPDSGSCPIYDAQFSSVIVVPGNGQSDSVVVAMGVGGVAVSDASGSFEREAVLAHGGESLRLDDGAESPAFWPVLAGPALLAAAGTPISAHIARRNEKSRREPIALCLLAAVGIFLFGVMSHVFGVSTTWIVTAVLSVAAFVLAYALAHRTKAPVLSTVASWDGERFVPGPPPGTPTATNSSAIAALVLGIVGTFMFLTAPLAIIFGHKGVRETRRTGQPGHKMAVVGLVLGYGMTTLFIAFSIWMQG